MTPYLPVEVNEKQDQMGIHIIVTWGADNWAIKLCETTPSTERKKAI